MRGIKMKPVLKMEPMLLGGCSSYKPPLLALIQTDGSYKASIGRAAVWLETAAQHRIYKDVYELGKIDSSTEAEYASIYAGICRAKELNEGSAILENDCLPVIHSLIDSSCSLQKKKEYARYYNWKIMEATKQLEWIGIRWIPRWDNSADKLFRGSSGSSRSQPHN